MKIPKKMLTVFGKGFDQYVKPVVVKLEPRANKVCYYGLLVFAQVFALIIGWYTVLFITYPIRQILF